MVFNNDSVKSVLEKEIISAHINAGETEKIYKNQKNEILELAKQIHKKNYKRILFTACGASYSILFSGIYLLNTYSNLDAYIYQCPELLCQKPVKFSNDTFAIAASYSGKTEDTIDALDYLNMQNIPNMAIVKDPGGPIGGKAQGTLSYNSKSLYIAPLFQLYILLVELMRLRGECPQAKIILNDLERIPEIIANVNESCRENARELAEKYSNENLIYILGSGPLYGLAYQIALTTLTEYLKMDSSVINPVEFRHGPLEMVRKGRPTLAFLLGNDKSRIYGERTLNFCRKYGAKTFYWDVKAYNFSIHPDLSPFIIHTATQWYLLYCSILKGFDLDNYLYMHKVLYYER